MFVINPSSNNFFRLMSMASGCDEFGKMEQLASSRAFRPMEVLIAA